jgi:glycosyltransferase involved in cell wall biosynthesis
MHLPPSPPGRAGWPWEGERAPVPAGDWPLLSVITPSFNQGRFLEETIRSVLLQGYPRLQYLVIDGGSRDESFAVIRKYEHLLTYWVSEPDRGQSHAINKGFRRAAGEIICWLNSDDVFEPGALFAAAEALRAHDVVYGDWLLTDGDGRPTWDSRSEGPRPVLRLKDLIPYWIAYPIAQPSVFFKRALIAGESLLDESLHCALDYDLWMRLLEHHDFHPVPKVLSRFRLHSDSKTVGQVDRFAPETLRVSQRYWGTGVERLRWSLSRWMWTKSINEAKRAVELSRTDRARAAGVWLRALARCPVAPLRRARPFVSAPYHIVRGW